jgi:hypothetical protein
MMSSDTRIFGYHIDMSLLYNISFHNTTATTLSSPVWNEKFITRRQRSRVVRANYNTIKDTCHNQLDYTAKFQPLLKIMNHSPSTTTLTAETSHAPMNPE